MCEENIISFFMNGNTWCKIHTAITGNTLDSILGSLYLVHTDILMYKICVDVNKYSIQFVAVFTSIYC